MIITKLRKKITSAVAQKEEAIPVIKKISDTFNRGILNEGRNFGLGFSILDKTSESEYKTLMAFTACKDYLNDFIYIESTSKPLSTVYGFSHKYVGILKDKSYFYTALKPLHYKGGNKYEGFDKIKDLLINNSENIIKFINKLEKEFNTDTLSEIEAIIENTLVIKTPIFWSKFSWLYSMYGLLIRCFLDVTKEDLTNDINTILKSKKNTVIMGDISLLRSVQNHLPLDTNKLLDYTYASTEAYTIHNNGIVGRLQSLKK